MYRKIIAATAVALYALLAVLAAVATDFHDRYFPQAIGVDVKLIVDFSQAHIEPDETLPTLQRLNEQYGLGLYKLAPDLESTGAQVFVDIASESGAGEISWFGNYAPAQVVGFDRLANSAAEGTYLVTGDADVADAVRLLTDLGVLVEVDHASMLETVAALAQQSGFSAPVIAACALIASITVLWLAVRARSRALRVLAGAAPARIQMQDLGALFLTLISTALGVAAVAAVVVGLLRGAAYVPLFLSLIFLFEGLTLVASALVALMLSAASWPSVETIALRLPAARSLRWAARLVQVGTLITLVAFAGPTWAAFAEANRTATQLAAWNELSDQVVLTLAVAEEDLDTVAPHVAEVISGAEAEAHAALSYVISESDWSGDFENYSGIALVNGEWIALMQGALGQDALSMVEVADVDPLLRRELGPSLKLWQPDAEDVLDGITAYEPAPGVAFPLIKGGALGQILFGTDVLVVEVPSIASTFDAQNMLSLASSGNIVLTGAAATQARLSAGGLTPAGLASLGVDGNVRPVFVAEQGILEAQFAAYLSGLLAVSLAALAIAFAVASAVAAMISGLMNARRDFPLRLTGSTWEAIVRTRALRDVGVGAGLAGVLALVQPPAVIVATILAAVFAVTTIYMSHLAASRAIFGRVARRSL